MVLRLFLRIFSYLPLFSCSFRVCFFVTYTITYLTISTYNIFVGIIRIIHQAAHTTRNYSYSYFTPHHKIESYFLFNFQLPTFIVLLCYTILLRHLEIFLFIFLINSLRSLVQIIPFYSLIEQAVRKTGKKPGQLYEKFFSFTVLLSCRNLPSSHPASTLSSR